MKILVVSQYFWPENFKINDFCLGLKARGHEVTVLTGLPNYPSGKLFNGYSFFNKGREIWQDVHVVRSRLIPRGMGGGFRLLINYFSFAFFAAFRVFAIKGRFDLIFVYEPSPVTVGIPGIVARRRFRAPMFFWVQDLWPESLSAAGGIKNPVILKTMDWLTKLIYRYSDKILIPSKAFQQYISRQIKDTGKIVYFPNSTEEFYRPHLPQNNYLQLLPPGFKIMFAGNIGNAQSFDTLLAAAVLLKSWNVHVSWVILGEGRMKNEVEAKVRELKIEQQFLLLGSFPATEMPYFFSCADALLVSLKKDPIFSLTIPSKVPSYLACGRPIIASLDGEGARIVEESRAGFACAAEDPAALASCIRRMAELTVEQRNELGKSARRYYNQEFERSRLFDRLEQMTVIS